MTRYDSIKPGELWLDTTGNPIQAHGFSVFFKDGLYYWYGENKERTKAFGTIWTYGVRCYVSKDFYSWEDKGLIIPPDLDDRTSPLHPGNRIDRPHIVYCSRNRKYVAWIKVMDGVTNQSMCVMQADDFLGPYEFVRRRYKPLAMDSGDFDLMVDEESGKAYIVFERPHFEMITATLAEDYCSATGEFSVHFANRKPPYAREAPVHFQRDGLHYLFTSGTTSYHPDPSVVASFHDFHGRYVILGDLHPADDSMTSFCSQVSDVIRIPGKKDLFVACADRWEPGFHTKAKQVLVRMLNRIVSKFYIPDRSPKRERQKLAPRIRLFFHNTNRSRYVFLPIRFDGDRPIIEWRDEWRLEDFE